MTLELSPDQTRLKEEGNTSMKEGDIPRAIELFSEAISMPGGGQSGRAVLFSNRAAAYMMTRDYESALEDADACVELNADWAKGWGRRGAALFNLGRLNEAGEAYTLAASKAAGADAASYRDWAAKCHTLSSQPRGETGSTALATYAPSVVFLRLVSLLMVLQWVVTGESSWYNISMLSMLLSSLVVIVQTVGRPRFSAEYLELAVRAPVVPSFILSSAFGSLPPTIPAALAIQFVSVPNLVRHLHQYLARVAPGPAAKVGHIVRTSDRVKNLFQVPGWDGMTTDQRFAEVERQGQAQAGRFELAVLLVLVMQSMLSGGGSLIALVVYPHVLKLRFMSNEHTRAAFHQFDASLTELTRANATLAGLYAKVRSGVLWFKNQGARDGNTGRFQTTNALANGCTVM